jgi:hypothetical protein
MNLDEIVCGGAGGGSELEDNVGVAEQCQSVWGQQQQGCIFYLLQNLLVTVGIINRD